jgi:hypothetical protein
MIPVVQMMFARRYPPLNSKVTAGSVGPKMGPKVSREMELMRNTLPDGSDGKSILRLEGSLNLRVETKPKPAYRVFHKSQNSKAKAEHGEFASDGEDIVNSPEQRDLDSRRENLSEISREKNSNQGRWRLCYQFRSRFFITKQGLIGRGSSGNEAGRCSMRPICRKGTVCASS